MTRYFILGILLLISLSSMAQNLVAYREASLNGGGPYFLIGKAIVEEYDNGSFVFRLDSNYATNTGPDVQVHLTNNGTFSSPISLTGTYFVEDLGTNPGPNQAGISHFSGSYSKPLPGLTSLGQFDHVVFVCVQFGFLHWGNGTFGSIVNVCSASSSMLTATSCGMYTAPSGAVYSMAGTYQDTILNAGGCDSVITLNLTFQAVDASTTNNGGILTANAANSSYQWIDCSNGNSVIPGATNQSFAPTANGSYAVIVSNGTCSDTSACLTVTQTNIKESDLAKEFNLYPNPSTNSVVLDLGATIDLEPIKIEIFNITGNRVFAYEELASRELSIDLTEMETGMYFVVVHHATGREAMRLLKQ